jgi:hypothetical protein
MLTQQPGGQLQSPHKYKDTTKQNKDKGRTKLKEKET